MYPINLHIFIFRREEYNTPAYLITNFNDETFSNLDIYENWTNDTTDVIMLVTLKCHICFFVTPVLI